MAERLNMPKLGSTMEEALITGWYKKEGENIQQGEFLLEVLTKKASFKIQSPVTGLMFKILATVGTPVAVGLPLAVLAEEGDEPATLKRVVDEAMEALQIQRKAL